MHICIRNTLAIIVSPYECMGDDYGLVVVTPRPRLRPQTFYCSHDNLKNPNRFVTILYI